MSPKGNRFRALIKMIVKQQTFQTLKLYRVVMLTLIFMIYPCAVYSSPWLESNDPFIRSSLLLASDTGQITSPTNIYPMRWSFFGDDLSTNANEPVFVILATQELSYSLNSARLNRGNAMVRLYQSSSSPAPSEFAQADIDNKGIYSEYDHLDQDFAFRVATAYTEYQSEGTSFDAKNSYLSLNSGKTLWTIGLLDRWWGQGWQHNLILGDYAKPTWSAAASYLSQNNTLGVWSIENVLFEPDNSDYKLHNALRFIAKPARYLEYGMTYQIWMSDGNGANDNQLALDAKLTLPRLASLYHSLYFEAASTSTLSELGAVLLGWTGAFPIAQNTVRIVLETQQTTDAHDTDSWSTGVYPSTNDAVAYTTYELDDSMSAAVYLQLNNDHQLSASYRKSTENAVNSQLAKLAYSLPGFGGKLSLGIANESGAGLNESNKQLWGNYELRF